MLLFHKKDLEQYYGIDERLDAAFHMIQEGLADQVPLGRTEDSKFMYHNTQKYETKALEAACWEVHDKWADVQYIRTGSERIDVCLSDPNTILLEENPESDYRLYAGGQSDLHKEQSLRLEEGMLLVLFPGEFHKACICIEEPLPVEKVVFKIRWKA